ncbi:MAG: enoyl-CoA hydratase-related protein [Actinobacteria bacterium]|nr:enoyl-CoA hydratase-related protein [Actinomycetota bacterium]
MSSDSLLFNRDDGVATITFNRPSRKNAFDFATLVDLLDILTEERKHYEDRVLIITGAGGSFCSGADVSDPTGILGAVTADNGAVTADSNEEVRSGANDSPDISKAIGGDGNRGSVQSSDRENALGGSALEAARLKDTKGVNPHDLYGLRYLAEAVLQLHRLPIPTIAKVAGIAAGAGLSLALACDMVVAGESARLSEIFPRRGLSLDGGSSWLLPRLVGLHKAKELAYFGDIVSAREALEIHLINRVVPDDELDSFVDDWARRLASGPTLAYSMTKTLLNSAFDISFEDVVEHEVRAQALNFKSHDTLEAMAAFLEKREPKFEGR